MKNRRAFTLLELIVSIAVTGVIALLVYGSAAAGFDTRETLARHRSTTEAELLGRSMLADALRHASDEADAGAPVFELADATDARGLPSDQLTFLTRGVLPPLGGSPRWVMTIAPTSRGLVVRATPVERGAGGGSVTATLAQVRGLDVQVMSVTDRTWGNSWPSSGQLPAAVQLILYDAAGAPVGSPVTVRAGLESVREGVR
jgi:prepilin-type N-terminal cleavage/methylation domain-containing protein